MATPLKQIAIQAWTLARQLDDPRRWPRLPGEVREYLRGLSAFRGGERSSLNGPVSVEPVLFQRALNSPYDPHYTFQSAWATREILKRRPAEHVDVSSSVPFVLQLAAVLPVTMFEFHPPDVEFPGLTLRAGTVVDLPLADRSVSSLSCLHVIEHVGLGRYGDPVDPAGTEKALRELARVVAPGGALFLSVPVGRARVGFNAHRMLDATSVAAVMQGHGLRLDGFALVDDQGRFHHPAAPADAEGLHYGCGMFALVRDAGD